MPTHSYRLPAHDPVQLSGHAGADAEALTVYVCSRHAELQRLPPKPQRSRQEQQAAAAVHAACRAVRMSFMRRHGEWLYSQLTDGGRSPGIEELVFAAAEAIPGLVPSRQDLERERGCHSQGDKEGLEIDQGIFFWGILRRPASGTHLVQSALLPSQRARALHGEFARAGALSIGAIQVQRSGQFAHVVVQNAGCLNAEDDALIDDMETAVDTVLMDQQVRVAILRGGVMKHPKYAGRRVFSAGINLKHLRAGRISFVNFLLRRELGYLSKMFRGLSQPGDAARSGLDAQKPWIAVVDSFAIGGGLQLLLVCDRVIAASDAYLSLPAAREGLVPGVAALRLSRQVGARTARQIIMWGRKLRASEPDARLLIDDVVDATGLDDCVAAAARQLDSPAVRANRRLLHLTEEPLDTFRAYMAEFALEQACRLYGDDVLRNVDAAT